MASVLIIDDDNDMLDLVQVYLEKGGYDVTVASGGDRGIDLFKEQAFDLVITDIFMPEKSGLTVIQELQRLNADIPIIALSGGDKSVGMGQFMLKAAEASGASITLTKPIERKAFLSSIDQLVGNKS